MAGRGPAKKENLQRESRTEAREASTEKLESDDKLRGFDLPEGDWHARTVAWWDTWRRSPQSRKFASTDWDVLLETALLHTALWMGDAKVAPELRLRVAKFGATWEDRQRLGASIDTEAEEAKSRRVKLDPARRAQLTALAGGAA